MNVEFGLEGNANGVMLPPSGGLWSFRDCFFTRPQDRCITSIGEACQGMLIDRCEFMSDDLDLPAGNRTSIALNINANDTKIRDNRFVRFGHFCVASGTGHLITGNHWFQGDGSTGVRVAGLVLTGRVAQVTVTGNYIDNASIEWTNEHHPTPNALTPQASFGGLTITGNTFCFFTRPQDRCITSIGEACQGMLIDRCEFMSDDLDLPAGNRTSIALNINANDTKIRDNRFVRFGHFCVASGTGHLITGNHWFQGDGSTGVRVAGLVLTGRVAQVTVTGNYIDNASIEWTNEHHPTPNALTPQASFGGLTITGNTFLCSNTVSNFSWIVIKPYGSGHTLSGLTVMGNVFKSLYANIDRVERVDTSYANLRMDKMQGVRFEGNTFYGIRTPTTNPLYVTHTQHTAASRWLVGTDAALPFNGQSLKVEAVVPEGTITDASGGRNNDLPSVQLAQGSGRNQVALDFSAPVKGTVSLRVRMDTPE